MKLMGKTSVVRIALLLLFVVGISMLHYLTPLHLPYLHDIYQRLYYLPIIMSALWYGFRGGLFCAIFVSIVYAPHLLFQWGGHLTMEMEKYLEILLYNIVGGITGLLSQKERERSAELQETASRLDESYKNLQAQSERIIAVEEKLRRSEKLSTLGEMAAVLAHEIRNPLGSIRGTAEILMDNFKPGDPQHEFIEIQIKETERLNRVVEDFLHMARPQQTDVKPCAVQEELEIIKTLVSTDAKERQIKLVLHPTLSPLVISADGEKFRQAFLNIIINALQATLPGGSVIISTKIYQTNLCEIRFRDTGVGIDSETQKKIFEPFFTTKPDGTGLGLAITKKIIETHGGSLLIESEAGQGTTVIVRLPITTGENI